jgi:hypothetical protein
MTEEEEKKLTRLEKRLVENVDFDDQALQMLGFHTDIYYMLGHLGSVQFSKGVSVNTHKEFAMEILMTMAPILDEGVSSLSFHLEGIEQVVRYEYIRELLGFQKGAPEQVDVHGGTLEYFWSMIAGEAHRKRNSIRNPIIQVFHSWMCKRILGRMRETKNWCYTALINRWCCEATSGSIDIGMGCYLSMLAISLRPEIIRNLEHLLVGTSLRIDYMKQGKYISGDERGGYKVIKVNFPLPDARLRLFLEGKEYWLEEGLFVSAKKNKRGRIIEEGSFAAQGGAQKNYVPPFGGIPAPPSYYGGVPMQAWGSGAAMSPAKFCGTQHRSRGAICTSSSTTAKCGNHWRIHCEKHAKYHSHPNQCNPNG